MFKLFPKSNHNGFFKKKKKNYDNKFIKTSNFFNIEEIGLKSFKKSSLNIYITKKIFIYGKYIFKLYNFI